MCWGKGRCTSMSCNDIIIKTDDDGSKVTYWKSNRYQLLGAIAQGNVSLTITDLIKKDEGMYCCRVEKPGPLNDLIEYIYLEIQDGFESLRSEA
ncbi:hypothetical protein AB205_0180450 [Aquarana catesbeiana]|uniref:Ig-like domain-containing protein n=1 Tax=Aquarana catesbeiana TaxID=8400 RepID=A0A2G9SKQ0_AQUCT|nr:hypothetical protein AB205_0180450 [Aquarana catesbeiana]